MARILVADDDQDLNDLVTMKLEAAGHEVVSVVDGENALSRAISDKPDLIVLDWMLPRRNGLEVCREVRSDPGLARTRILMLTARAQEVDVERAFAAGAEEYITKPFSPRELVLRVATLLSRPL
ncbi:MULTISPECIES: response regulator transcription factor [unclassified Microcella]|uniref:response regulator transcription factor n=1 Tax=unclassified Microcella TaxID=2630066 RepID=UPI0006F566EC|nr:MULTISPECIES: response regulator [unclassified Microcella]KQV25175.1 histidine kinase [Yonghaparkia sp. Root332]KRF31620.1 histidine kinase [Yonghaparkia sp. Soil809]